MKCLIKYPHREPISGSIKKDLGENFLVLINGKDVEVPKIYVYPCLEKKKTQKAKVNQTKKRRKKGEGTYGIQVHYKKKGLTEYQELWFHYEKWDKGTKIKRSRYIPKALQSKVLLLNKNKASVSQILQCIDNNK